MSRRVNIYQRNVDTHERRGPGSGRTALPLTALWVWRGAHPPGTVMDPIRESGFHSSFVIRAHPDSSDLASDTIHN